MKKIYLWIILYLELNLLFIKFINVIYFLMLIYSRDSFDFRDQDIKIVIQKC